MIEKRDGRSEWEVDGAVETDKRYIVCLSSPSSYILPFFCLAFSVSLALSLVFLFLTNHRWSVVYSTWIEWVGSPVVLTAPDRAILMGADDD